MSALTQRRDPIRLLLSRGLWAGLWYLLAYQVVGWVLFSIALTAVATGAMFSVTVVGVPLLITAAAIVRWCADVERARLRPLCGEVVGGYREPAGSDGMVARLRVRWQDPALWRDIAYLVGLFIPLVLLGLVVLTVWGGAARRDHHADLVLGALPVHQRRPLPRRPARLLPERLKIPV